MIVQAELVKRATDDGLIEFEDDVDLGRLYSVDLDTRRILTLLNDATGEPHTKEVVNTVHDGKLAEWLPVECLRLLVS